VIRRGSDDAAAAAGATVRVTRVGVIRRGSEEGAAAVADAEAGCATSVGVIRRGSDVAAVALLTGVTSVGVIRRCFPAPPDASSEGRLLDATVSAVDAGSTSMLAMGSLVAGVALNIEVIVAFAGATGARAGRGALAIGIALPRSASVNVTIEQYPSSDEITRTRPSADHATSEMAA
jgi:hypothetical protein